MLILPNSCYNQAVLILLNSLKDKKKYKKPTKNLLQNKRESGGNDKIFNTNNLFQESNSIYYEKGINLNKNSDIKNFSTTTI